MLSIKFSGRSADRFDSTLSNKAGPANILRVNVTPSLDEMNARLIAAAILGNKMTDADGFVTAGGRSSRMGKDKAWLELDGQPMIGHVITALMPVTTRIFIIANSPEYARLGFPVFADKETDVGPLEAIRGALEKANTSRVILVGCDLPFVTSELFKFLLSIENSYQAIVPVGADGKLEPLCAVYCTEALPVVRELILSGERKVSRLFDRIPTRLVALDELSHLAGSELFFENVNTPGDYERAIKTARRFEGSL